MLESLPDPGVIVNWMFFVAMLSAFIAGAYRVTKKIEKMTAPIQSGANGGASLPDANRALVEIKSSVNRMHDRMDDVHSRITELAVTVGELRGEFNQHSHPRV